MNCDWLQIETKIVECDWLVGFGLNSGNTLKEAGQECAEFTVVMIDQLID